MTSPSSDTPTRSGRGRAPLGVTSRLSDPGLGLAEQALSLRPLAATADSSLANFPLPPAIKATIAPIVNSFRWGALLYGMAFGAATVIADGSNSQAIGLTICLFMTVWRTVIPVRLGSSIPSERFAVIVDTLIFGLTVGYTGASASPYIFCVAAAIVVASFGWGYMAGFLSISVGWMAVAAGAAVSPDRDRALASLFDRPAAAFAMTMAAVTALAAFGRSRLVESEQRRRRMSGRLDTLAETNDLLTTLNSVARSLPTSLNQRDALESARAQINGTFRPTVVCLMEWDESHEEWVPKLADGCAVGPATDTDGLPGYLSQAVKAREPLLISDLVGDGIEPIGANSASGMYTRLMARRRVIGVLGIESSSVAAFDERDRQLLSGMAGVLALTYDNARWFGRLRSLGAEEERGRIARDIHDRLGQWLTYISLELERIIFEDPEHSSDLDDLHRDVRTALDELRDTLGQLRSEITEERPLSVVGKEMVTRFEARSGVSGNWAVTAPEARLSVPVENELLRILQEALNNVEKHAHAESVEVTWHVERGGGTLTVVDDGSGFEPKRGVRDNAYGLVGMRERADVVGARLTIDSTPGEGTCVTIHAGSFENNKDGN